MARTENLRREARVSVRIRVAVIRGRRTVPLETTDVSFKGLFLQTDEPPPLRSLMRLRVSLPSGDIEAHAMAVHVTTPDDANGSDPQLEHMRGCGVGVQFWGLAGPDRKAWDDFVRDLIQKKRAVTKRPSGRMQAIKAASPSDGAMSPSGVRIVTPDDSK